MTDFSSPDAAAFAGGPALAKANRAADSLDPKRFARAWRAWLASLATDAEAAMAAAHLYAELPEEPREAWLQALAEDASEVGVPPAALYGPLLAVEADPQRRTRICAAGGLDPSPVASVARALRGTVRGSSIAVLVQSLYLDFVRVLICQYSCTDGFELACQQPLVRDGDAPRVGEWLQGAQLKSVCPDQLVDELAHAVVAHRRRGRELPRPLRACADLFSPRRDVAARAEAGHGDRD